MGKRNQVSEKERKLQTKAGEVRLKVPKLRAQTFETAIIDLNLPLASHHSITSSARASSVGGTSRPSALAVTKLMAKSNIAGYMTGKSAFISLRDRGLRF